MLSLPSSLIEDLCTAVVSDACSESLSDKICLSDSYSANRDSNTHNYDFINFSINTTIPITGLSQPIVGLDSCTLELITTIYLVVVHEHDDTGNVPYDKLFKNILRAAVLSPQFEIKQVLPDKNIDKPYYLQYGDQLLISRVILNKINECAKPNVISTVLSFHK